MKTMKTAKQPLTNTCSETPLPVTLPGTRELELLIQAFYYRDDDEDIEEAIEISPDSWEWLLRHGMVVGSDFMATAKGKFFITHLLNIPIPVAITGFRIPTVQDNLEEADRG